MRRIIFKFLYWIEKKIDPRSIFPPVAKPKYPRYSRFVFRVCMWAMCNKK